MLTIAKQNDLVERIGHTPLLRLGDVARDVAGAELWAKAEWFNPSGSVKDRAAWGIVRQALARGELEHGRRLLDATSGNTGIAYATLGAALGFAVTLVLPASATPERRKLLQVLGAELIWTDPMRGMDEAQRRAHELHEQHPGRFFLADQYRNDANWRAHYESTGPEILSQTCGRVTHFVAGLGTTGTFVGTARCLRQALPRVRCVGFIPDSPYHGIEGLKHLPTSCRPAFYDEHVADEVLVVRTERAQEMVLRLARTQGLFVGMSAGAAVVATLDLMRRCGPGVYVTVLPDNGFKYLSDPFFDRAGSPGGESG